MGLKKKLPDIRLIARKRGWARLHPIMDTFDPDKGTVKYKPGKVYPGQEFVHRGLDEHAPIEWADLVDESQMGRILAARRKAAEKEKAVTDTAQEKLLRAEIRAEMELDFLEEKKAELREELLLEMAGEDPDEDEDGDPPDDDYNTLTVKVLRAKITERELACSSEAKKGDLIGILREADKADDDD